MGIGMIMNMFFVLIMLCSFKIFSKECAIPPASYNLFKGCYERRLLQKLGSQAISIWHMTDEERSWGLSEEKQDSVAIVFNDGKSDNLITTYCSARCFEQGNTKPVVQVLPVTKSIYLIVTFDHGASNRNGGESKFYLYDIMANKTLFISKSFPMRRSAHVEVIKNNQCYKALFSSLFFKDELEAYPGAYSVHEKKEVLYVYCESVDLSGNFIADVIRKNNHSRLFFLSFNQLLYSYFIAKKFP